MSQTEMARRLTALLGRPYYQTTLAKVIAGQRQLTYAEVVAVVQTLDVPLPHETGFGPALRSDPRVEELEAKVADLERRLPAISGK
jgi:uncharacterized protein YceH (UPF0502 family)